MLRASSAFLYVVVNISIRVCESQSIRSGGKVSSEPGLALTVLALHARETNLVVLDLASTACAVLFGESACLHLLDQEVQIVSH